MSIEIPAQPQKRYLEIDFLRGSAVFLMLVAHINFVFTKNYNFILDTLTWFGATICFSVFIFCFAFSYGLKLSDNKKLNLKKETKRFFRLLFVYYGSAFCAQYFIFSNISIEKLYLILTFQYLPVFTEFIIPFFLYVILILIFFPVFKKLLKYPILFISISLAIYFFGQWLYPLDGGGNFLNVIKTLLVGNGDVHAFGVLSYLPIFVLGLIVGESQSDKKGELAVVVIFVTAVILFAFLKILGFSVWHRFPPSVLFLLYGVIYSFGVLLLYRYLKKIIPLDKFFIFLSKKTLFIFFISILIILGSSNLLNKAKFESTTVWLIHFLIIAGISLLSYSYGKLVEILEKR
ncbi:MAG: hypothetical protein A3J93_03865 [Candidatus Magasanikbacteria bacterium RIFOXYC2_FULL_42_28]|uniref:Heparan-alpha-glucosaminide N-acetyltransferase catalytic domain-containing protein n=1 Tax=Candidatus Magasanikbacteria bacterium RIFOXYC2_FULL_42_28 TaxID=1798704 RepID=A0A1F6NUM2_9BACT|nr:MAG: hypothetical protein A3J93_03865 [Candidatus Magasanikbacteria bacterium RIFOXYC2_FULL_42_28]